MHTQPESSRKPAAHIVSHTHWDREWRYPIWETRLMLVAFMDELIDVLESGKYPSFLLDGQVIPLLDYLEVRPEMAERLDALVKSGKLLIGPWYTLPDEYPVDGECLVRNLLWGCRKAEALGGATLLGYTSFGWGQTAQLPQIYAGFGMDVAMVGKRVDPVRRAPNAEFIWRGPDGSELLCTRFGPAGRHNFYFYMHLSALWGVDHMGGQWAYDWANGGIAYHRADRGQMEQDHARLDPPATWHPEIVTKEMAELNWRTMDDSLLADDRLMMNGCDYTSAQPLFPEMVARLNEVDPEHEWIHTGMAEYVQLMKEKLDRSALTVVEGELRDGPASAATANALATRLYIKRMNKQAQNLLIRYAEPLTMLLEMAGAPGQDALLEKAWQFLLESHPHDSINGVTQDKLVRDVLYRLDQVIELSEVLGNRAMQELVKRVDMSNFDDGDVLIMVVNPLPYPRREIVEAFVNMPCKHESAAMWGSTGDRIQMYDADGQPVGTQWQGMSKETYCVTEIHTRALPLACQRHLVYFDTGEVPACGYKLFRAGKPAEDRGKAAAWSDLHERTNTLRTNPHTIENEYLRVVMNLNGTFDLTDKSLGHTFPSLNYYEDRGEHGDYWINEKPMFDQVHTSLGCSARIWTEESGPLQATLLSEITMRLPARGIREQQRRGDALEALTIRTAVTLHAGQRQVDVRVTFENRHEDHYLRAMFPTHLSKAMYADAGGHFIVDRRPIRPQGPSPDIVWPDMATLPQNNFVDVSDGEMGIAFLNDSLTEYEVEDNAERTVALSLLRSMRNWICTEMRCSSSFPSQKGGQCLGGHEIRYALYPHEGDWRAAQAPLAAERFNAPVRLVQTRAHEGVFPAKQGSLFVIETPELRFSALKKAQPTNGVPARSYVLRVYNPTHDTLQGRIRFHTPVARAWRTDLNEQRVEELSLDSPHMLTFTVQSYAISTIEFEVL